MRSWRSRTRFFSILLTISIFVGVGFSNLSHNFFLAQESQPPPKTLTPSGQAIKYYQAGQYQSAIALWEQLLKQGQGNLTTIHNNLAVAYYKTGQFGAAIRHGQIVVEVYKTHSARHQRETLAKSLIDLGQAYNALGRFQLAIPQLQEAIDLADSLQFSQIKALALMILGDSYQLARDFKESITAYSQSLTLSRQLKNSQTITQALTKLSRVHQQRSKQYFQQSNAARQEKELNEAKRLEQLSITEREQALKFARQAVEAGQLSEGLPAVEAMMAMMSLDPQVNLSTKALATLENVPDSRSLADALINLANWFEDAQKVRVLQKAAQIAQHLGDLRTKSFALGTLGKYYEEKGDWEQALQLTQSAQLNAQQMQANDSLYRWQWQAGRIYQMLKNSQKALLNYRGAVYTLEKLRQSLLATNTEFQLDVREQVEPVYRQFISLLLEQGTSEAISEALSVKEKLQLAELEDFFKDKCAEVQTNESLQSLLAQTKTAVIHFFIAPQKTYTILQFPNGKLRVNSVKIEAMQLTQMVDRWRLQLEDAGLEQYLPLSQKLYDLLMRPLEVELKAANVKQLVFVSDGILRNVPMTALHDGQHFLIERYPIAVALGLDFISQPSERRSYSHLLAFGLTYSEALNEKFPYVATETQNVANLLSGKQYLNQEFTQPNLRKQVENNEASIVHLATHGQFGGTVDSIFLESYDSKISLENLESILSQTQQPIELLTLSACQTAAGNERSILGLAGIAIRSGVRSTLGSLWFINDAATSQLITDFYQYWQQPGATKVEALQKAQLRQIKELRTPVAIWAPFVLIGGWI